MMPFDPRKCRNDFHVLTKGITYLDSSCVSLKPKQVVDAINSYYNDFPACAGRSNHSFAREVTTRVEDVRKKVARFVNAKRSEEIIFTRNTTEGINLIAHSLGLKKGDKVVISDKEHNSNLVPWLHLKKRMGILVATYKFDDADDFSSKVKGARLASFVHTSNLDGSAQDVPELARIAHENGALVLIDAAQGAPHKRVDVRKMNIDFLSASGHKMLGPSGTGFLYGKYELLEKLDLFMTGGETVKDTTYDSFVPDDIPHRFEAGLQDYSGIIGLGAAIDYLEKIGMENIAKHEMKLNSIITDGISTIKGLRILGPKEPEKRSGIISFTVDGVDPHDIALQLDSLKIMIRSGYHCCHSWFNANSVKGSARASLYLYNTEEDAKNFVEALKKTMQVLR